MLAPLWFASIAIRANHVANISRTKRSVGPVTTLTTRLLFELTLRTGNGPSSRGQIDLTLPSVAKALAPLTKESRRGRREARCNGRCRGGSRPLLLRARVRS
jgi:hypothetical protein